MFRVKVHGAGSIGNHLSNACRQVGWSVDLCDIDEAALERTRTSIYPGRYGKWDDAIRLFHSAKAPRGGYDLIFIGTPPSAHLPLALDALAEKPRAILIEKPACTPDLEKAQEFMSKAADQGVAVFVGYDHVVGKASAEASRLIGERNIGDIQTLDVEIREHWGGIFAAHPWLDGPHDSYLGYVTRGGGACAEHSHGINLWQHFAHQAGMGRVVEVSAMAEYVNDGRVHYDKICAMSLRTEAGLMGRVVQDVVTRPPRKWARLQGSDGYVEWYCNFEPGIDICSQQNGNGAVVEQRFQKTRPDDFIMELRHIAAVLDGSIRTSPISGVRGMDTMLVIAAAHKSAQEFRTVKIDYSKGYSPAALI